MKLSFKKRIVIDIIGTMAVLSYSLFAFIIGIRVSKLNVQEICPPWHFFGTSDWSTLFTSIFITLIFIWSNILIFSIKVKKREQEGIQDKFEFKKIFSFIKVILNFILCLIGFPALLALKSIWYGYESNYAFQWTLLALYYEFLYLYLIASIFDYIIKFITYNLDGMMKELEEKFDMNNIQTKE